MVHIDLGFSRERVIAVVDVRPGSVAVALATCPKSGASEIRSVGRSALPLESRTSEHSEAQLAEHVREAASQCLKIYNAAGHTSAIHDIYVIAHAPWLDTQISYASEEFDTETGIRDSHIAALAKKSLDQRGISDAASIVEASVIQVLLNGYPTAEPVGKKAHRVGVDSLISTWKTDVRSTVEAAIRETFPIAKISWRSAVRAFMTLARESHIEKDILMIDMGVDDTHLVAFNDNALEQLVIPEGIRSVVSKIVADKPIEETLGYLRMVARDACSTEACEVIQTAKAAAEPQLVKIFGEAIAKLAAKQKVSDIVFLSTHADLEIWLSEFLTKLDFSQFTVTSLPLSTITTSTIDIGTWVEGATMLNSLTVDVALINIEGRS